MASSNEAHSQSIFKVNESIPNIAPEKIGDIGVFSIANTTVTIIFIALLFILLSLFVRNFSLMPKKFQSFCELVYDGILSLISQILGNKEKAKKIIPYVGSIMLYLIVANLLPMMPLISSFYVIIDGAHIPLLRGATTDFNTTFGLALAVIVSMQFLGMKEQGVLGYLSHFIQVKQVVHGFMKGLSHGFLAIINFFVGLIEIISEVAKTLSLSLRLFGNMFAHEVLTIVLLGVFSFALPALWMGMGVLVGIVQALVFSALVTVYYSLILKKDEH